MPADSPPTEPVPAGPATRDHCVVDFDDTALPAVLVVEDDPATRNAVARKVGRAGYPVHVASDGRAALDLLARQHVPIVISDWLMPGLDGPALCTELRTGEAYAFTYFIMLTALDADDSLAQAFHLGVDDYIAKPVRPSVLYARLTAARRIVSLEARLARKHLRAMRLNADLALTNDKLVHAAHHDDLTGLHNRQAMRRHVAELWQQPRPDAQSAPDLACLICDVDRFKRINDTHGHFIGDLALQRVAHTLRKAMPRSAFLARLGGDEFITIAPANALDALANAFQNALEQLAQPETPTPGVDPQAFPVLDFPIRITAGLARTTPDHPAESDLFRLADDALYQAKENGRGQLAVHPDARPNPPHATSAHAA